MIAVREDAGMDDTSSGRAATCHRDRLRAARLFVAAGLLAILAGGLVAAAIAHAPTRHLVWMVAYLVLVAGLAQGGLGCGQAALPRRPPGGLLTGSEWLLFNLGNAGVIAGTLAGDFRGVAAGTLSLIVSLALFTLGVRTVERNRSRDAYHALIAVVGVGALVGLALSAVGNFE